MNKLILVILLAAFTSGCQYLPDRVQTSIYEETLPLHTVQTTGPIEFQDETIEKETRKILDKPTGPITPEDVSAITVLGDMAGANGIFGDIGENVSSLVDLKWFTNLETLVLSGCELNSLSGVETLANLQTLYVRRNNITDLAPVAQLTNLKKFDCSENYINDITPLANLIHLEELGIGNNQITQTDLAPLENLVKLERFYAPWCGITDLSVLANMPGLQYLQLSHNNIEDIRALAALPELSYIELSSNNITDIQALEGLSNVKNIFIQDNNIPEADLEQFYEIKEDDYFTKTIKAAINETMPEFTFDLSCYFNKEYGCYSVETITVTSPGHDGVLQTIQVPELSFWGETRLSLYGSNTDTMGFQLEDLNFDGFMDIRLFDTNNGNYRDEWIYLVWNPELNFFAPDQRLNHISLARFDQENKLIYGTEKGSAVDRYLSTYRYIDGTPTLIRYEMYELVENDRDILLQYLEQAGIQTEVSDMIAVHESVMEYDESTGDLAVTEDYFVLYPAANYANPDAVIFKFHISSEIGQQINTGRIANE